MVEPIGIPTRCNCLIKFFIIISNYMLNYLIYQYLFSFFGFRPRTLSCSCSIQSPEHSSRETAFCNNKHNVHVCWFISWCCHMVSYAWYIISSWDALFPIKCPGSGVYILYVCLNID